MLVKKPPEFPVSDTDWQQTPVAVQRQVVWLWEAVQALTSQVAQLQQRVVELEQRRGGGGGSPATGTQEGDAAGSHPSKRSRRRSSGKKPGAQLWYGQRLADDKTAATCANLLAMEPALWTFVRKQGVEPTNNTAERALRHGVLWRHTSFGTHSPVGSRFVERMLTVRDTLRQQQRNVLEYLTTACRAALCHQPAPSLLPTTGLTRT